MTTTVSVDWLSIHVPLDGAPSLLLDNAARFRETVSSRVSEACYAAVWERPGWEPAHGRKPYPHGYHHAANGIFMWHGHGDSFLMEFSGRGCEFLRDSGFMSEVIVAFADRVTRCDIAIDVETEERPIDFAAKLPKGRFKSFSTAVSDSGETHYVGSRKSERYARIYRYNEPHPRSHLLRIEFVVRKPHTQPLVESLLENGVGYVAAQLAQSFEMSDHIEGINSVDKTLRAVRNDRASSKTLRWLIKQCAPAFKKLCKEGIIDDPYDFLTEHFLPEDIYRQLDREGKINRKS